MLEILKLSIQKDLLGKKCILTRLITPYKGLMIEFQIYYDDFLKYFTI